MPQSPRPRAQAARARAFRWPSSRALLPWLVVLLPMVAASAASTSGCSSDETGAAPSAASTSSSSQGGGGEGGGAGGQGGSGTGGAGGDISGLSAKDLFLTAVLPGLDANCKLCHESSGIADFLLGATPDEKYASITGYKSGINDQTIIWPFPDQSILYTYPDSNDHNGVKYLPEHPELKQAVLAWLVKESANLAPPEAGTIDYIVPFKPIIGGLNAIYLDPLGPEFTSTAITFIAHELGSPASILQLTNFQVYPAGIVLRIVHPRLSVFPADSTVGEPDPVDSMQAVDQTFIPQMDPTLGTGEVLLTNWQKDARLAIDFDEGKIESYILGADGGIVVPCKAIAEYQEAVESLGNGGPQYCAATCHGGNKAEAQAAMDLSGLLQSPPDYDTACANMRARIKPGDVDNSQITQVTNPAQLQIVHMYKFAGNLAAYNAFKTGMTSWIVAE